MLKKTQTYTDYDGNERTEDLYFNLTKAEVVELNMVTTGGLEKTIDKMSSEQDMKSLYIMFKDIILRSYGEKSLDGKRFIKSKEISEAFSQTEAFSDLILELLGDAKKAADFINAVLPKVDGDGKGVVDVHK